jgi:acetyl esterase/lipase
MSELGTSPREPEGVEDLEAWKRYIAESNAGMTLMLAAAAAPFPATTTTHDLPKTVLYEVVPDDLDPDFADAAIFYLHGGAYIQGAGLAGAHMATPLVGHSRVRAFVVDYRMPPDHPFPDGLNDAIDAYRFVLETYSSSRIVVAGGSAGGGIAAAFTLKARDLGLPLPAGCVLISPEIDLTESGDSFETNIHVDVVADYRLTNTISLYANGHDLRDPYVSPLFGDFSTGFPPTLLTCGTRDLFLSNTVLMYRALRRAGIPAQLDIWEAMPHGGFFGAPEDEEALDVLAEFVRERMGERA